MENTATRREYRAAAVFYGGVSLAVYENGVARAFFDAAKRDGVFGPLMDLLNGNFVVDVISGSSAGGINGLMLATALENGTDFKATANLWREAGGMDELLRNPNDDALPMSLLRGETYYISQLRKAFRSLTASHPAVDAPGEIDVFVTGTDLTGQQQHLTDAAGSRIDTMEHRVVFHLKHRRHRSRLGLSAVDAQELKLTDAEKSALQADILASVARTTSSFPGAFPPFTTGELANERMADSRTDASALVRRAMERLSNTRLRESGNSDSPEPAVPDHYLVDGGVLDNKPFGRVLDAIFHRMPSEDSGFFDRKLFYIEPDPVSFHPQSHFSPLQVILNSTLSLPMYDSIAADLKRLEEHNNRVRRFKRMRQMARKASCEASANQYLYGVALQHALGCMLVGVNPSEVDAARALNDVLPLLDSVFELPGDVGKIQSLDINFHLRRVYALLYDDPPEMQAVQYAIGRVVKALKLLRDTWVGTVNAHEKTTPLVADDATDDAVHRVKARLHLLYRYLDAEWFEGNNPPTRVAELNSDALSHMKSQAQTWLQRALTTATAEGQGDLSLGFDRSASGTYPIPQVLRWLENALRNALGNGEQATRLDRFSSVDACLFPAELAAGLYELDEIELIRISPKDAKLPDDIQGADKVTGDKLAHFSAFLRRDWRTNDIAWGHSDGLCQIITALLCEKAWKDIDARVADVRRRDELRKRFEPGALAKSLCGARSVPDGLDAACAKVLQAFDRYMTAPSREGRTVFRDALITAAQIAAMGEYTEEIVSDTRQQNSQWRWKEGVERFLVKGQNPLIQLKTMKIGASEIKDEIPGSLMIQYVATASLLLFGMVGKSIAPSNGGFKLYRKVGRFVTPLLGFVRVMSEKLRTEPALGVAISLSLLVGGLSFGVAGLLAGAGGIAISGFAVALLIFGLLSVIWRFHPLKWVVIPVIIAVLAGIIWICTDRTPLANLGTQLIHLGERLEGFRNQ